MKIKNFNYVFNLSELNIKVGDTLKFFFWTRYKSKKRIYSFFGLIIKFKNNSSMTILNTFNSELIKIILPFYTPLLLKSYKMFLYKSFSFRLNKLNFIKKISFKFDIFENASLLYSSLESWNYDMLSFFPPRIYSIFYYRTGRKKFLVFRYRI